MINYTLRSYEKELLDREDIPFADIRQNMVELEFINTHLGGHSITIEGFKKILNNEKSVSICEIGCGGGDNLNAINNWCTTKKVTASFTGIDINANCIAYAKTKSQIQNVNYITSDYRLIEFNGNKPGIIFSSLFCHHFTNEELIEMMKWMDANSSQGFFINDLHRHPVAYQFIKLATKVFSKSYLVKNDAPLSVLRGFKKKEWVNILEQAGIKNYSIKWKWAFRHLIVVLPPSPKREQSKLLNI
jgi:2-polyprenyl-3-methyl-5-hydroxy-6-metoxy-1,4-benzoquinol methylase